MSKACFNIWRGNFKYPVANWGHLYYIAGNPGTQKTTQLAYLTASALSGEVVLGYDIDLQDRCIVIIDGEQPQDLYMRGRTRIEHLCGGKNLDRLIYPDQTLASIPTIKERETEMWKILFRYRKDIGLVIIDRIGNFVSNINDQVECGRLVRRISNFTADTKCLPIAVSHMTQDRWGLSHKLFGAMGTAMNQEFSGGTETVKSSKYFGTLNHKSRYEPYPPMWVQADDDTGYLKQMSYIPYDLK